MLAIAIGLFVSTAFAGEQHQPPVSGGPVAADAQAAAGASAGANIGPILLQGGSMQSGPTVATGTGGQGGAGGLGGSGQGGSAGITDQSQYKSGFYAAPAPVWAMNPANKNECIVNANVAFGIGWNFLSFARADQMTDKICTNLAMAVRAYEQCQFKSAAYIQQFTFEELNPKATKLEVNSAEENLTGLQCMALKATKLVAIPGPQGEKGDRGEKGEQGATGLTQSCIVPPPGGKKKVIACKK